MAAKGGNRGDSGNTKIRFIMLEAEGSPIDLQQIAQAITSAVRPTTIIQQIPASPVMATLAGITPLQSNGASPDFQPAVEIVDEGFTTAPPVAKKPGRPQVRRYPTPDVIELDLTSGDVPFVEYFNQKNPDDHSKRYLVIAAWLKEYRQIDEISHDHIYTCYRILNLNPLANMGGVFRGCKKQGWFNHGSQRGSYSINHVGLNQVNNLNGTA